MNIGIVTTWTERGASYVSRQYMQTLQIKHNVLIYARGGDQYEKHNPVWNSSNVHWGKKVAHQWAMAIDKMDFTKWIKQNRLDMVIFNEQSWWYPIVWANELGVVTGAYVDYYTEDTVPLFAAYDFLLCNTRRHLGAFDWHAQSIYVPWGTDVRLFCPKASASPDSGRVTFFHSCGMSPLRKGTDLAIRAFASLAGSANMIVHSQVPLQQGLPAIASLIEDLVRKGALKVVEGTVTAPGLYSLGDVYVYPSRLEGIGLTIIEALACGLPVIVPDNPPMNEFCVEESGRRAAVAKIYSRADGYYWPQCEVDIQALAFEMQFYIDHHDQLPRLKSRARFFAEQHLDWVSNSAKLCDVVVDVWRSERRVEKNAVHEMIGEYERKRTYTLKHLLLRSRLAGRAARVVRKARALSSGGTIR